MPPSRKTIIGLTKATEDSLVRLLANERAKPDEGPPFPDDEGGGKSASQKHREFLEALLGGDAAEIEDALKNKPSVSKITEDLEIARVTHIVQSFFQQPGGTGSIGLRVYDIVKRRITRGNVGPDPTFW
jgi:hypothetical protein